MTDVRSAPVESASRKEFVWALVQRQIRVRRKRALLGLVWPAIAPYFMLAIYTYIFHAVFHSRIPHYSLYLFAGLLPWTFFVQALLTANTSISEQSELIRRTPFAYELLPIAAVMSVAVFFLANTAIFAIYLQFKGELNPAMLIVLVLPMMSLSLFTLGMSYILALIDVYNRDLRQILGNLLTIWFFLTPIVYRPNMAGSWASKFEVIDPMQVIIAEFRDVFYLGRVTSPAHYAVVLFATLAFFLIVGVVFRNLTTHLAADV